MLKRVTEFGNFSINTFKVFTIDLSLSEVISFFNELPFGSLIVFFSQNFNSLRIDFEHTW